LSGNSGLALFIYFACLCCVHGAFLIFIFVYKADVVVLFNQAGSPKELS